MSARTEDGSPFSGVTPAGDSGKSNESLQEFLLSAEGSIGLALSASGNLPRRTASQTHADVVAEHGTEDAEKIGSYAARTSSMDASDSDSDFFAFSPGSRHGSAGFATQKEERVQAQRRAEFDNTAFPDHPHLHVLHRGNNVRAMHTIIRDRTTPHSLFVHTADRLMRLVVEEGLGFLPCKPSPVTTPVRGAKKYTQGMKFASSVCGVATIRSGEAMEAALRQVARNIRIGKVLIRRDGGISGDSTSDMAPELIYARLPEDVASRHVLLLDPVLATGDTCKCAIQTLLDHGVKPNNLTLLNLMATRIGVEALRVAFPDVSIVTTSIEDDLSTEGLVLPGVGDFGDRYFGTKEEVTSFVQSSTIES